MKRGILAITIVAAILALIACAPQISEGDVYGKEFKPEHTQFMMMPITINNGKTTTTVMMPYTLHYPDRWVIYIKAYDEEKQEWVYEEFYVSEEVYNSVNIGSYFVFDDGMGTREEPYTKTRR